MKTFVGEDIVDAKEGEAAKGARERELIEPRGAMEARDRTDVE
jgi:hypothetical protein